MSDHNRFALIGQNITYSRSPRIFEILFAESGLTGSFELIDTAPDNLAETMKLALGNGVTGFSVTIPHKQSIIKFLDELDSIADAIGAVNSIAIQSGKAIGSNTDAFGFTYSFTQMRRDLADASVLIIGSGGGARAVAFALATELNVSHIDILARRRHPADRLAALIRKLQPNFTAELRLLGECDDLAGRHYRCAVNCTPLGGPLLPDISPLPDTFAFNRFDLYYDLNYSPDSRGMAEARRAGIAAVDGSMMLVAQAVRSFENWTGHRLDIREVARTAIPGWFR